VKIVLNNLLEIHSLYWACCLYCCHWTVIKLDRLKDGLLLKIVLEQILLKDRLEIQMRLLGAENAKEKRNAKPSS
jgi:hypothetical protein